MVSLPVEEERKLIKTKKTLTQGKERDYNMQVIIIL